jgi:hypothetical protein
MKKINSPLGKYFCNCFRCDVKGECICSNIKKNGKCLKCNGKGKSLFFLKCKVCKGTGLCPFCEGKVIRNTKYYKWYEINTGILLKTEIIQDNKSKIEILEEVKPNNILDLFQKD